MRSTGLAFVMLAAACAATRPATIVREVPMSEQVQAPGLLFEIDYTSRDADLLPQIREALLAAGPRVARWGAFRQGVHIRLLPDHDSLELALERKGYPWLRAWAYGDEVLLQSPRTWEPDASEARAKDLGELLAHELTHALMYQLLEPDASSAAWPDAPDEPPLWFREGMASVTADQGYRRPSREEISKWIAEHPGVDVFHPSPELYRTEKDTVYGVAHRAFAMLLGDCGDDGVRSVLKAVHGGARFADAFRAATGRDVAQFESEVLAKGF